MNRLALYVLIGTGLAGLAHGVDAQRETGAQSIAAFGGEVEQNRVFVKFQNGAGVMVAADGTLNAVGRGLVPAAVQGTWLRSHHVDDAELTRQRVIAEQNLGRELPDLTQEFVLILQPGMTAAQAIDALRAAGTIDYVTPVPKPVPAPLPPNYRTSQRYLNAATEGIGSSLIWTWPGGTGSGVRVCDVEYSWNTAHLDLPSVTHLGPLPVDPFNDKNHGTAVLGEMLSINNNWGTVGAVYGAAGYTAAANTASGYNVGAAITSAAAGLNAGDVILIEQQAFGPNGGTKYVPVEWALSTYNAIVQAVGNGIVVVEAAGNGGENLDAAIFSTGNGGHWPFLAQNDSGAIIVGAGAAPASASGSTTDRSRLSFSCYGSTVDLQGWGERVTTTGYGGLYSAEGTNYFYTSTFNGTSSASPIVASACVGVQGVHKSVRGSVLTPAQVKSFLRTTGSPQQSGINPSSQNIGPRPDARAALLAIFGPADCNTNGIPDEIDIIVSPGLDLDANLLMDACQCDDIDFNNDDVFPDNQDVVDLISVFGAGPCSTGNCNDIDFNNDEVTPDLTDLVAFIRVYGAGACVVP